MNLWEIHVTDMIERPMIGYENLRYLYYLKRDLKKVSTAAIDRQRNVKPGPLEMLKILLFEN